MTHELNEKDSKSEEIIAHLGHHYDGIQEYDNPLPGWWKGAFWLTIVFSILYLGYFHAGASGRSIEEQYLLSFAENTKKQYAEIGDLESNQETILAYMKQPKWVNVGGVIFKQNCVSCHGSDGGGNVGPNLCDDQYKHVQKLTDIFKVINDGVAGGAMPAWGARLGHKNDTVLVAVYVASLRGSKPTSPKAPDGSPIEPWPKAE
ncbi:MAG: cbb3-type cytochrome c oxidase N-terminal domain-containing protein [Pirellulaceae bacterium]|nr:cbb3-type cytochrome c oxidase N-terminal domain-containing protein [Pirellulaceae bacterium]